MAASVQFRPQNRDLGKVMREVDENLAIFLGMKNDEKQRKEHLLVEESHDFDDSKGLEPMPDGLLTSNAMQPDILCVAADDNLLNLESENSDFDWLLSQPDPSIHPSVELGVQDPVSAQTEISDENISAEPEPVKPPEESASESYSSSKLATSTIINSSSAAANKRPSSSGGRKPNSRAATATRRQALPANAKAKPSRASTPNSGATLPSSKPTAMQSRSSTPAKGASRSSTPSTRPTVSVVSKLGSRSGTPTRKPSTPSISSGISATAQSSSGKKTGTTTLKNPVPSRGTSPTVKSRPPKLSESLSHDAMENLKKSLPKRPASATRGRRSAPDPHLSSSKPRQTSCSPAKVRVPVFSAHKTGSIMLSRSRGHSNGGDDVNPVLMGTQMVERVVNMRKLAPPKQDEYISDDNPRKSSQGNSGFGRSLSKKSLDMAIRHMDIRRSINDNIRPISSGALSSSSSGARSGSAKSNARAASESPVASQSDSSESGISMNSRFLDGSEADY